MHHLAVLNIPLASLHVEIIQVKMTAMYATIASLQNTFKLPSVQQRQEGKKLKVYTRLKPHKLVGSA